MAEERIAVEVVYALPDEQHVFLATVAGGATVRDAIVSAGVLDRYPDLDLDTVALGIFGERTSPDAPVKAGDRVELYRPLIADPKESRRRRAARRQGERAPKRGRPPSCPERQGHRD